MKKSLTCDTPYCSATVWDTPYSRVGTYHFCHKCRQDHSSKILIAQVEHGQDIKQVILDARMFKSASAMADYIGVSFVTLYHWIEKYFGLNFQEFKRKYICKSTNCISVDITRSSYSRHDYILKKLRGRRYCACINTLDSDQIVTNAPISVVREVLRGAPRIDRLTDSFYKMVPDPIYWGYYPVYSKIQPVYFNI